MTPQMEAEQALLGAVLLDPARLKAVDWLEPKHFYRPAHAALYQVLLDQAAAGHPGLDPEAAEARAGWATDAMTAAAEACPAFTAGYGHTLIAACPVSGHAAAYGRMVLESWIRRQVHEHAHRLLAAARTGDLDATLHLTARLRSAVGDLARAWGPVDTRPHPSPGPWPLELPDHAVQETLGQERALLASLTALPRQVGDVTRRVHPLDLLDRGHQALYRAIGALGHRGEPIDPLTVLWEVQHRAADAITADAVRSITRAGFAGDPDYWADEVLKAAVLRSATASAGAVRLMALDSSIPAARLLGSCLHALRQTEQVQKRWRTAAPDREAADRANGPPEHRRSAARARTFVSVPDTAPVAPSPAQQAAPARAAIKSTH
ncbi:DnaB-like helicase N-terminal domain-containing protein [Kitasatospora sp. NPDC057965]|uniref:DnaB-like helicase N-terminal domain-containing protein n=1 Tax=Kitasatospora sp. NPDC057965 TaxID=3346291 RepID=UPI0036DD233F